MASLHIVSGTLFITIPTMCLVAAVILASLETKTFNAPLSVAVLALWVAFFTDLSPAGYTPTLLPAFLARNMRTKNAFFVKRDTFWAGVVPTVDAASNHKLAAMTIILVAEAP